jgi:DNA-binding response OmpR family regulator
MTHHILIVDDEKQLVYYLRQTLSQEFLDSKVDGAYSGEEALSQLAAQRYDLILADLRMPGFDGLELIRGVRYIDATVPIVLMTGYGSGSIKREAAELGVNHYISKPFSIPEMMAVMHELLDAPEGDDV